MNLKKWLNTALIGMSLFAASAQSAVYVVAHPDDMQLMMAGNAIGDIQGNYPTVIIILSAGDARNLNLPHKFDKTDSVYEYNTVGYKYYRVRMDAHEASIKYWIPSSYPKTVQHSTHAFSAAIPAVERAVIGNVVTYYLNLPDTQVAALYDSANWSLQDVEGINTYTKATLRKTIRDIIKLHFANATSLAVNYQESDPSYSEPGYNEAIMKQGEPGPIIPNTYAVDHGDHTAAGKFTRDAIAENSNFWCIGQIIYMGYASSLYIEDSFAGGAKLTQENGFKALHNILVNEGNQTWDGALQQVQLGTWDAFHRSYFGKQKFRVYGINGAGACNFAAN